MTKETKCPTCGFGWITGHDKTPLTEAVASSKKHYSEITGSSTSSARLSVV